MKLLSLLFAYYGNPQQTTMHGSEDSQPTPMHQPTPRLAILTLPCVDAPADASCTHGAARLLTVPPRRFGAL
jgi:hypothetical protein